MPKSGLQCKCGAEDHFTQELTIFRYPQVLIIHLRRFDQTPRKINTPVEIPKVLDMTDYGPYSDHKSKIGASTYKLYGICHHKGKEYLKDDEGYVA